MIAVCPNHPGSFSLLGVRYDPKAGKRADHVCTLCNGKPKPLRALARGEHVGNIISGRLTRRRP